MALSSSAQVQMLCTGLQMCILVEYNVTAARAIPVKRDNSWIAAALRALEACWMHFTVEGTMPPFDTWTQTNTHPLTQLLALTREACATFSSILASGGNALSLKLDESKDPMLDHSAHLPCKCNCSSIDG
jgi:hypothetical protein